MDSYQANIDILADELSRVEDAFRALSPADWKTPTQLVPVDPTLPLWTVFELAGHFDISIGLTRMLIAGRDDTQPARDRTSFFINPRSESAPVVYGYAYTMVEGKTPGDMPDVLHETFAKTIEEARAVAEDTVGPGYFASMRVDGVCRQPHRRGGRPWPGPDAAPRTRTTRVQGGDCRHRSDPRRPAGPPHARPPAGRPGRRPRLGDRRLRTSAVRGHPAAADRLTRTTDHSGARLRTGECRRTASPSTPRCLPSHPRGRSPSASPRRKVRPGWTRPPG